MFRSVLARVLSVRVLALGALALGVGASSAVAMPLVPGGYGSDVEAYAPPATLAMGNSDFSVSAAGAGLTMSFTPRASGTFFDQPASGALPVAPTTLSLGVQDHYAGRLRLDSLGLIGRTPDPAHGLALGGAFSVSDWQLTGTFGRANLLGEHADVFSAGVGYGPLNARLVYGHVPRSTGPAGDVLMLSTDLAAWSWLTLQGDVAVSDTLRDEPLTVGRVGLRLNF